MKYFNYATGLTMTNKKFSKLFNHPVRDPKKDLLNNFHMDIASSIQAVTEEIVIRLTRNIAKEHKIKNLCLAGGVALNCVANGKILKKNIFKDLWIQPASGDAGGSLGAALAYWYLELKHDREISSSDEMIVLVVPESLEVEDKKSYKSAIKNKLIKVIYLNKTKSTDELIEHQLGSTGASLYLNDPFDQNSILSIRDSFPELREDEGLSNLLDILNNKDGEVFFMQSVYKHSDAIKNSISNMKIDWVGAKGLAENEITKALKFATKNKDSKKKFEKEKIVKILIDKIDR